VSGAVDVGAPGGAPARRTALVVAVVVGLVLAGLVVLLATREPATERVADSPLVGRPAPDLAGAVLLNGPEGEGGAGTAGGTVSATANGRFTLVNFFAVWCVPCVREHPELVSFSRRHAAAGDARVVSVVYDDEADNVVRFFEENGGEWPVVGDDDGRIALDWGVAGIPESYLVAPDGTVVSKITGGVSADGLDALLDRARAAGRPAS
jgi:cytochrome c biogenesis protein CcmG/thiol:disulfide interchange protein DsbE